MGSTARTTAVLVWLAACGGSASSPPPTPPPATAPTTAAPRPQSATCMPANVRDDAVTSTMALRGDGHGAVLCRRAKSAPGPGFTDCWRIDATAALHAHADTSLPAGIGHPTGDDWSTWAAESTDGKHRATGAHSPGEKVDKVEFYALASGAHLGTAQPSKDINNGVSAAITAAYLVGDVLFLRDSDAGPHEDVVAFASDGSLIGIVEDELSEGTISIADAHRVVFAHGGLLTAATYDVRTRRVTKFKRAIAPADVCSQAQVDSYATGIENPCDEDDAASKACCAYLTREVTPYMGALAVPLAGDKMLVVKTGKHSGAIEIFDAKTGKRLHATDVLCPVE